MDDYDKIVNGLMESESIQVLYDTYIIKDITFKEWVIGMIDEMYMTKIDNKVTKLSKLFPI